MLFVSCRVMPCPVIRTVGGVSWAAGAPERRKRSVFFNKFSTRRQRSVHGQPVKSCFRGAVDELLLTHHGNRPLTIQTAGTKSGLCISVLALRVGFLLFAFCDLDAEFLRCCWLLGDWKMVVFTDLSSGSEVTCFKACVFFLCVFGCGRMFRFVRCAISCKAAHTRRCHRRGHPPIP